MRNHIHIVVILMLSTVVAACNPSGKASEVNSVSGANSVAPVKTVASEVFVKNTYTLVMLGDSLTAGLGLAPDDSFPSIVAADFTQRDGQRITVRNAGVSGDTTASGLARFDWSVGPGANGVLIALGANDMLNGLDPAQTRTNLGAMIETARARKLDVFLAGMRASANLGIRYGMEFDAVYSDLARAYCVPLFTFLLQPLANDDGTTINQNLIQADGLHPTKEGAARIGHALSGWLDTELATPHIPCTPDKH